MILPVKIVQILIFIYFQFDLSPAEPLLKNVRNFVEEATKGLNLVNLSNYAVDFAHLNGHLLINKEQFEAEIAEQEAVCSAAEGKQGDNEASNGNEQLKKQKHDKMNEEGKRLKPVDPNQLSNHHSVTYSTTLLPSPYPRELFQLAVEIQPLMAELHFHASFDIPFLLKATKEAVKSDSLIAGMVKIMKRVERKGRRNPITVIMQRSDYLTDEQMAIRICAFDK